MNSRVSPQNIRIDGGPIGWWPNVFLNMKEDPIKAKAFDEAHTRIARWGPNHPGARELAKDYTNSKNNSNIIV